MRFPWTFRPRTLTVLTGMRITMPRVEVTTEQFGRMQWPLEQWGTKAVVYAGMGVRDQLRTAYDTLTAMGCPMAADVTECVGIDLIREKYAGFGDRLCHVAGWSSRFAAAAAWHGACNELVVFYPLVPNGSSP